VSDPISRVTVIGGGYMGTGILQVLAQAGIECVLTDVDEAATRAAYEKCLELAATYERRHYFTEGAAARIKSHSSPARQLAEAVVGADFVIEAVPENVGLKRRIFAELEDLVPEQVILASNTSSIPIAVLADGMRNPERLYGVHWFNPAQFLPAVELIAGPRTTAEATDRVLDLLRHVGRTPVLVADSPGFTANRLQFALFREAALMVEEGLIGPDRLDEVVRGSFGYRLPFFGPFEIADIAGLDVYAAIFEILERSLGPRFRCPPSLRQLVADGHLGMKNGQGYCAYAEDQRARLADDRDRAYVTMAAALAQWRAEGEPA
jgi:3-hydroxybutyryl-CoA dehydrogenase